jgi:hypothetical protein
MIPSVDFLNDLRARLDNPAISDPELVRYIDYAKSDVDITRYSSKDYINQVLDSACQYLFDDGKFPEISSISAGGVTTSFAGDGERRFRERLEGRRQAAWMNGCY